jgi:hypothetical protein
VAATEATVPAALTPAQFVSMSPEERQYRALQKMRDKFDDKEYGYRPVALVGKEEYKKITKGKCKICNGYHAVDKTAHLTYVGHAAITNRLLDCDPLWTWVPMALEEDGSPKFDNNGGLWGYITVAGVTRPCYGNAEDMPYSEKGAREKAVIGDLIRNGCMRFGGALELWHKGTLSDPDPVFEYSPQESETKPAVEMPVAASPAKKPVASDKAQAPAAQPVESKDAPLAEEGEVKFITKKISNLTCDQDKFILDTIGVGTLEGLTKASFDKLKAALKTAK